VFEITTSGIRGIEMMEEDGEIILLESKYLHLKPSNKLNSLGLLPLKSRNKP
jgi:hypothetical protein